MSTPEENAAKTDKTDPVVMRPGGDPDRDADQEPRRDPDTRPAVGAELQDAMERADVDRDDLTGER
ncbi:hypothetical protein [Spirillospora sp. NPDC029432]|uniref:hypothetical protein n=1 Tax=Spirillospora sp. NPDC029432 TaxID=3154599 RepID=UPI003456F5A0